MSDLFPKVYQSRPWHDDWSPLPKSCWWLWPLAWIPRRWTGFGLAMPPHKVCGNGVYDFTQTQSGYPLAPDCELFVGGRLKTMHPVHDPLEDGSACWSVQSVWALGRRIPCYFTWSRMVCGRRLHFNIGLKPDVTPGDWYWWLEFSLSWTKRKEA